MKALWMWDGVTHRGEHFTVVDGRIEPKPVQRPLPPVWIGGWGDVTLRRAALLADAWLPGPTAACRACSGARLESASTGGPPGCPTRPRGP